MSITETLLLIALILFVVDFFIQTDVLIHVSYILGAIVVARWMPTDELLWQILWGVLAWFLLVIFHYIVWRSILKKLTNKFLTPDRNKETVAGVIGRTGKIHIVENKPMLYVDGDPWSFDPPKGFSAAEGLHLRITGEDGGLLKVEPIDPS